MNNLIRHGGKEHWAQFEKEMKDTRWYFLVGRKVASQIVTDFTNQSMAFSFLL